MTTNNQRQRPITILDYGAGNVASVVNALNALGYADIRMVTCSADISEASCLIFPGVGAFKTAMDALTLLGYREALLEYLRSGDRPFLGICVGMQVLFSGSEESPGVDGLSVFPGQCSRFSQSDKPVPHIGWTSIDGLDGVDSSAAVYYVHSYAVMCDNSFEASQGTDVCVVKSRYGGQEFVAAISRGRNLLATQFHPEKSGRAGLEFLRSF
eukprot:Partr_v1_DN19777_c0_g1_i1_m60834 putative Imidazole glycerol phosphate synthase subunit hisf